MENQEEGRDRMSAVTELGLKRRNFTAKHEPKNS